jgi:hypothetical protein
MSKWGSLRIVQVCKNQRFFELTVIIDAFLIVHVGDVVAHKVGYSHRKLEVDSGIRLAGQDRGVVVNIGQASDGLVFLERVMGVIG